MRAALALVAGFALGGCSFAIDDALSYRPVRGGPPPACMTSSVVPILDGIVAAAAVTLLVLQSRRACSGEDINGCRLGRGLATMFLIPPAVVYGSGALVGTAKVTHCRNVTREHAALQR